MSVRNYSKAIIAAIPAGLAVAKILVDAFGSAHVGPVDYTSVVVAILAAVGVYGVKNVDDEPTVTLTRVVGTITPAVVPVAPVTGATTVTGSSSKTPPPPFDPVPLPPGGTVLPPKD